MTTTTVYIADDHALVREGLCAVIGREPDFEVVGHGGSGRDALRAVTARCPDVVVMDVAMTDMNGMEATHEILRRHPQCRVIAVSSHGDQRNVLGMLQAGASAYVLKSEAFDRLMLAIREAMDGRIYLSPSIRARTEDALRAEPGGDGGARQALSHRERQIVQLVAEGRSSAEIAVSLNISPSTVETHRRNVMRKLDLRNAAELTRFAIREGLTHVDG